VRLIYLDEAGRASEAQEPIFVRAAVIVHADFQWRALDLEVKKLVHSSGLNPEVSSFEFHAHDLYSSAKRDKYGPKERRWNILRSFLKIIHDNRLPVLWSAVKRRDFAELKRPYSIDQAAVVLCLEEVDKWFRANASEESGLLIVDRTEDEATLRNSVNRMRETGQRPIHERNWQPIWSSGLDHIVDTMHFVDSTHTWGVQMADACAFFIKRHLMGRPDEGGFYATIKSRIAGGHLVPTLIDTTL
jgi:hypothetical protein